MAASVTLVKFICKDCGHIWDENYEEDINCPKCHSENTEEMSRTRY
jgi:predicted Zn-ribbon and HTH transcriptional regulator